MISCYRSTVNGFKKYPKGQDAEKWNKINYYVQSFVFLMIPYSY